MKPKFLIGIGLIMVAVVAVIAFTIMGNSNLEVQVNDLKAQQIAGTLTPDRALQLTGVVVGDSITYDPNSLNLQFDVVNDRNTLANHLTGAQRVHVVFKGVKPDSLVNEAQAIVKGKVGTDGTFHAGNSPDALLLQCPTKYDNSSKVASK